MKAVDHWKVAAINAAAAVAMEDGGGEEKAPAAHINIASIDEKLTAV